MAADVGHQIAPDRAPVTYLLTTVAPLTLTLVAYYWLTSYITETVLNERERKKSGQ